MTRVVIMAGGTGGHVFPALALADELRRRQVLVSWLGTKAGIESRLVPQANIDIDYLSVEGVRGRGLLGLLKAPFFIGRAIVQSLKVLKSLKPDVVVGFGGFASGPGGVAAKLLGVPLVIHEQNAIAGTTNKILSRVAIKTLTGFENVFAQGLWVGNPVRASIQALPEPSVRYAARGEEPLRLLVLGGSLGALAINELVPSAVALIEESQRPQIRHQCGAKHVEITSAAYVKAQVKAKVEPFIEDMSEAYGWADYVICRAGALTVAELASAGVAALLVPLPSAIDDHQTHNAAVLAGGGAALSVAQRDLNSQTLADLLHQHCAKRSTLLGMAENARKVDRPEAVQSVANQIEELANG
ncbi:undecaprenyldiphospho-muramoylpentapeptide beta-N-acetylglucosaminyltransferase [Gilvimarinus agarilyticus]|uniref:undecaprenyldiphospho-muramoylpentapeptide beta-N-acetylglucosaminyltransferase n=1 Tax=unclassified Gilvimarinus TaxID=2642066 RepID=UPI001C084E0C|nr:MULTISPECIES: undecaprenyldiphospho-muramoylpentapeptide beta-N-acetylglucosaminyltransferase [unclassified Gilvimarinus]MBU2885402.1 undecaprenyldiphospho-muramoylpentapeptide beta-N-acetylglucosaminyltransferase [Gilvimarinus agarilyticus]MDO6570301.1 undecaprenyldiphospho-muramoylpentapeptide beta-N-acetylglucosaminyltransferase [Gilvimarinus sp. 2_MG-2023]MDO6746911.1 undecaprenyldiphospho-muramoylpentapeptide beta-N-acetylglucosaminyltransferase [Gilvimarinus sp. 1_MG-2023]